MRQRYAIAVSRLLRKNGFGIVVSRKREGLLVTCGINRESCTVCAQFDSDNMAKRRAEEVAAFLRENGYTVRLAHDCILNVSHELPAVTEEQAEKILDTFAHLYPGALHHSQRHDRLQVFQSCLVADCIDPMELTHVYVSKDIGWLPRAAPKGAGLEKR